MQGELFEPVTMVLRPALIGADGRAPLFVIGCGRSKLPTPAPARDLYTSSRFRSCVSLAQHADAPYVVLSAKHGVLDPSQPIDTYDVNLEHLSPDAQNSWAKHTLERLAQRSAGRLITLLLEDSYASPILNLNQAHSRPLKICAPWLGLGAPDRRLWIDDAHRMAFRINDLDRLYRWINERREGGTVFPFSKLSTSLVPKRGVYIFLDPSEPNFRDSGARVVRIGTHAVSAGSQTSLRTRLRNHLGPATEIGNHRGSIFRLHVGRAMLESDSRGVGVSSWGEGQDASHEVKAAEQAHEIAVSRYLQKLEVVLFDIDDEPSKNSRRAQAEAQLIALLSDSMRVIDLPSTGWLGFKSPVESIRRSGLWNIRGVGGTYDPRGAGSVTSLLEGTDEYRSST